MNTNALLRGKSKSPGDLCGQPGCEGVKGYWVARAMAARSFTRKAVAKMGTNSPGAVSMPGSGLLSFRFSVSA